MVLCRIFITIWSECCGITQHWFNTKHNVQRDTERVESKHRERKRRTGKEEEGSHAGHLNAKAEGSNVIITPSPW